MLTILTIWFFCGIVTATLLVLHALVGRRWQYVREHKTLLTAVLLAGPVGWLAALVLACVVWVIVRIGNNGGFQER